MKNNFQTRFDKVISGYIVDMPKFICLASIEEWIEEFHHELDSLPPGQQLMILINTNQHEFESIQCLKKLREFFTTNPIIQSNGVKAAFVGPRCYMEPHQKSAFEAYFETSKEAYKWLKGC